MADNGNSVGPPVPPRRTKRKIKIATIGPPVANSGAKETTDDVAISQQKRPPPPPPLSPEKCRRNNSGYVETRQPQCDTATNCRKTETEQQRKNRVIGTASETIETKPRNDTTSARDSSTSSNRANNDPIPKSIVSKPPFLSSLNVASKRKARDKYPSLFFTLHDFENVMSDTWNRNDSANSGDAQNLHEEDDGDVCFRVTTTKFPFEKCSSGWKDPFDDCRFDSTNPNGRINNKRSSGYDIFDDNDASKYHTGTKVRFKIESPSSSPSKRDSNEKIGVPLNSSRNRESILDNEQAGEQSVASSVKLTEVQEEFADVKDRCDNTRDKSRVGKGTSMTEENDPLIMAKEIDTKLKAIPQTCCDDGNNDINCEKIHEQDSNLISWNVRASDEIFETTKGNVITSVTKETITSEKYDAKQMDQGNASSGGAENVHRFTDKSSETTCGIEGAAKITQRRAQRGEKMFLKETSDDIGETCAAKREKIFVDESPRNFLDKRNDDEPSKNVSTGELINKTVEIEQTRRLPEEKRTNFLENSKNNSEIVSPLGDIFVKNIPVKVSRNSFLETMLPDLTDISVISAVASTSLDKELSATNKSPNKIWKVDADVATQSERSRGFCGATETNAKNQKNFKSSKKIEERIKIPNVRSTRSDSKSATDVKSDVLNELLSNFNNIKLKIVGPENEKSLTKTDDDENTYRRIAIDDRISKGKKNASKSLEKFRNETSSVPVSNKTIDANRDTKNVEKEDLTKMKTEKKFRGLKIDTPAIREKITENKNIETKKPNDTKSCDIKSKIARDNSEMKTSKNPSDIKSGEINVRTKLEKTSEGIKSLTEANREPKKLSDIRVSKTILKKTNVECERQVNEFQKRIPIGAPATMNKIFDSREFKAIADASRKGSLANGRKRVGASREIRTRGEKKTDAVNADDKADGDRKMIADRSALALVEDTTSSGVKCAIARKITSVNPCNNNDNNRAVTPVANVSNDQSFRDVVTITPGKVRSFVQYYEIRGDEKAVERYSKINDREKVAARRKFTRSQAVPVAARSSERPEVITKGKETEDRGRGVESNDYDLPGTSYGETQPSTFAPRDPEDPLRNPLCETTEMGPWMTECEKGGSLMSDKETRAPLAKTGAKKSVQFLRDFTVIRSETFGEDESAGTDALRKRRAPGVPPSRDPDDYRKLVREIAKSKRPPNVGKHSLRPREAVTQIHAVADHAQNSGFKDRGESPGKQTARYSSARVL